MKINFFLLAFVVMLVFVNCSKENSIDQEIGKEVKVTASLKCLSSDRNVSTRVTNKSFEKDDAIGLFMINSGVALDQSALAINVKYTCDGSEVFSNPTQDKIYFPFNREKVDFISYYPYSAEVDGFKVRINLPTDQSNFNNEFVYSNNAKELNSVNSKVNLEFGYYLVRVVVNIYDSNTNNIIDLQNNNSVEISITNINTSGSFLLNDCTFANDKTNINDVIFKIVGDRAEAILLPNDDLSDNSLLIKINGDRFIVPLANSTISNSFAQSTEYTYSYTLGGSELNGVSAIIKDRDNKVIIDNVFVTPDNDNDSNNPDSPGDSNGDNNDGGDGDANSGEEGSKDDSGDSGSGDIEPDPGAELGSQQNPYTIAGISTISDMTEAKDIWVKGFIVGSYNDIGVFYNGIPTVLNGSVHNLALADSHTEIKAENTFPVDLNVKKDNSLMVFYEILNLEAHPNNLKKEVLLRGDIGDWMPGEKDANKRLALINLKEIVFEGESYPK